MTDKEKKDLKKQARAEEDKKRAQTDVKPGNHPQIGREASCDDLKAKDPKAPKAAEDAAHNPGKAVKTSDMDDYDEKVSQIDGKYQDPNAQATQGKRGKTKEEVKKEAQAEEDKKRAQTDVKPGNHPQIGREASCDDLKAKDPKAPKAAEDAAHNPGKAVKTSDMDDYDEKVSQIDGKYQDPNAQATQGKRGKTKEEVKKEARDEDDKKRAQTNMKAGENPQIGRHADADEQPKDPKAPKAADDAAHNPGKAVKASGMEDYDEKVSHIEDGYEDPNAQARRGERKRRRQEMAGRGRKRGSFGQRVDQLADHAPDFLDAEERLAVAEARLQELEDKIEPAFNQVWDKIKRLSASAPIIGRDNGDEAADDKDLYEVDPHVIEKVAAKATESVDGILGLHKGIFGNFNDSAGVTVRIEDEEVVVRLKLILDYDAERDQVFEELKKVLKERIESAFGMRLKAIQISIEDMMTAEDYRKLHK